jgi:pimeloyl-ACP methyl ester carboxylesterase
MVILLGGPTNAPGADDGARAVVTKAVSAHGGQAKLARVRGVRVKSKGTLHVAGGLPYTNETIYEFPGRFKDTLYLKTVQQTLTTGLEGDDAWMNRDGETLKLNAKLREEIKNGFHLARVLLVEPLQSGKYELTPVADIVLDGRNATGVKVSAKGYSDIRLYFDAETYLLVKSQRRTTNLAMKEVTEDRTMKDYQDIGGIKWPKAVTVLHDGVKFIEEEITDVELVESFEAAAFAKPERKARPQEPKRPFPYGEEEVSYENQKANAKLAGTLTLPPGKGPFPAVVLITGSGQQDRDESLFGHRPFFVLADYLTRRGIAVLRVDDRGVGGSTGNASQATSADFADDVRAGVAYLKGRKEIDPGRIGLIGHSEGGLIAPMVAAESNDIRFIVLLAAPGLPGDKLLETQGTAVLKSTGATDKVIQRQRQLQQRLFAIIKESKESSTLEKRLKDVIADEEAKLDEDEKKAFGSLKTTVESQLTLMRSPWLRFFLTYDPRGTLAKVRCPVLAMNGDKDVQVDAKENLPAIAQALEVGGNRDVTIKELPKTNHLFQTCTTGALSEYAQIEETLSPAALELMGDWIVKRAAVRGD